MMLIWTPNLAIGVPHIDEQHKELFSRADKLFEAGRNRKTSEYISELLDFLEDYTIKHFSEEEKLMKSINYPHLAEHMAAHVYFKDRLKKLKDDYTASGCNILVILEANNLVGEWLINHVSRMDKKIGDYINEKGIKAE